ncbi:MAG: glycosyltransferase family 1 protein [Patescibacteria group bacterium]|nr:glycosyltransferase family 1 protein [Patescibacteria group bacterium]
MKKIGIDARFYGPKNKGLGRYAQKLIENLEYIDGESKERTYFIFLKKENFSDYHPQNSNFKKIEADFDWYSFREQAMYPKFLSSFKLDLMHFCHFNVPLAYRRRFIVTVHDLILFHFPTIRNTTRNRIHYIFKLLAYQIVIRSAVKRAKKVIAVSKFTKQDIMKELHISEDKIVVTYEGCDSDRLISPENSGEILEKYGIMKPYLLYVGNAYPHKNLEKLVLAYKEIKKSLPEVSLVLVGGKDFFYAQLEKYVLDKKISNVVLPGYVPDNELDAMYKNAELYIFPSLYEGFGLPPLEALARNTPVASSSKTSMPEILEKAVLYFDPESVASIAWTIETVLKKPKDEIFSRQEALKQVGSFSWNKMARQTLSEYRKVI